MMLRRFANEEFITTHETTQSVEYRHRFIETDKYRSKVQLWDCVSSVSKSVTQSIYRGSNAIILLFDVTVADALDPLGEWLHEILHYAPPEALIYLVGTKIDIPNRQVSSDDGRKAAERLRLEYWELSSKTGEYLDELFFKIISDLQERTVEAMESKEIVIAENEKIRKDFEVSEQEKRCCACCCSIQ